MRTFLPGRNRKAAEERAHEFNVKLFNGETCDLFVNATPVTDRDLSLADNFIDALKDCKLAFDHELEGRYLTDYCATHRCRCSGSCSWRGWWTGHRSRLCCKRRRRNANVKATARARYSSLRVYTCEVMLNGREWLRYAGLAVMLTACEYCISSRQETTIKLKLPSSEVS
ncbi:hypothetical protein SARC_11339 [Sphaeroforma arctica JP610]|uniref:Uncharacterized protein n=1 Tax=Sphaeroforma arctica JP610 TaxID=667725 RepID=A0A0L0FH96_9EUKA|nr:hypothetical protein SARC_11339 [Sphaeroforma arctica JP610]KNC76149.1 hypothetical protein SARC_11339 [Sphaeroforma arctica JP610]|eukprot:XP_014150051.1 hypothetical protein SARC_11339 [Sphaeroforma arctica JP610]